MAKTMQGWRCGECGQSVAEGGSCSRCDALCQNCLRTFREHWLVRDVLRICPCPSHRETTDGYETPMYGRDDQFPIMGEKVASVLGFIPWDVIASHDQQAQWNHSQTLQRLRHRGGLSPCEAVAVLEDRPWRQMHFEAAVARLKELAPLESSR